MAVCIRPNKSDPIMGYGFKKDKDEVEILMTREQFEHLREFYGCGYERCMTTLKMKRGGCIEDFMQILLTNGYGCRIIPTKEDGIVEIKILEMNNAEDQKLRNNVDIRS